MTMTFNRKVYKEVAKVAKIIAFNPKNVVSFVPFFSPSLVLKYGHQKRSLIFRKSFSDMRAVNRIMIQSKFKTLHFPK